MTLETKRESIFNVCCLLFCSIQDLILCLLSRIGLSPVAALLLKIYMSHMQMDPHMTAMTVFGIVLSEFEYAQPLRWRVVK